MSTADTAVEPPERFSPMDAHGQLTEAEHLTRYRWATQLVAGRRVLDVGCGMAYGSALMAEAGALSVTGVDNAATVLEQLRPSMPERVVLLEADATEMPFEDASFDVVVCFEMIEHVADWESVLDEIRRVLSPSGVVAISSPNRERYVPGNQHHVHEFLPDELAAAVASRFSAVRIFRQQGWIGSALMSESSLASEPATPITINVTKAVTCDPGAETYFMILAGDGDLPEPRDEMVLTGLVEVRHWSELYDQQQAVLGRQHAHFENVRGELAELQELRHRLTEAEQQLAVVPALERDAQLGRRDLEALESRTEEIARLLELVAAQKAHGELLRAQYDVLVSSSSWKLTKPLRRVAQALRRGPR